ncbi:MAG: DNA-3-methyladenine glycosylase family protein [Promethearchaeota archaeon]
MNPKLSKIILFFKNNRILLYLSKMLQLKFPEKYDLSLTVECGQIFRFFKFEQSPIYFIPLKDRIIKVEEKNQHTLEISSNKREGLEELVNEFFRVNDDYLAIIQNLRIDSLMDEIIGKTEGLHLLKQDPFECMNSFIISQFSNIPRITQNLNNLANCFGKRVIFEEHEFFLFPSHQELFSVTEEQYRELGLGYRAKYLYNFNQQPPKFFFDNFLTRDALNNELQQIHGVGAKVADCVQLFGFGDLSYFPVDTWMRKFMQKHYFSDEKKSPKEIRKKGQELFGKWAGYAQEFIYHYARVYDSF